MNHLRRGGRNNVQLATASLGITQSVLPATTTLTALLPRSIIAQLCLLLETSCFRFGIRNLRRLSMPEPIELRKITVLVGRNSSGKSTFLRSIPLLRQSVTTRIRSPILWYGEDVDFGSFVGAVNRSRSKEPISFTFGLDDIDTSETYGVRDGFYYRVRSFKVKDITIRIDILDGKDQSFISFVQVLLGETGDVVELKVSADGVAKSFLLNKSEIIEMFSEHEIRINTGSIAPEFIVLSKKKQLSKTSPRSIFYERSETSVLSDQYVKALGHYLRKNQSAAKVNSLSIELGVIWPVTRRNVSAILAKSTLKPLQKLSKEVLEGTDSGFFDDIKRIAIADKMFRILRGAADKIRTIATDIMLYRASTGAKRALL